MLQEINLLEEKSKLEDLKFKCGSHLFLFYTLFWFMFLSFHVDVILGLIFVFVEVYVINSYRGCRRKIKELAKKLGESLPWWLI